MINKLEHKFSIKRVEKTLDGDYIKALRIYNDTTPFEIKTPTNEITFWINNQKVGTPFEMFVFVLYLNDEVIGLSMTTYIKSTKVVVDEYLAVCDQYRIHTIYLAYESLIHNYYQETGLEIAYYITEISYKDSGTGMDRESKISLKMLCVEDYGKIEALYYALPLGLENYESNFIAHIYIKAIEPVKSISCKTYQNIVESMYYDYWYTWYSSILIGSDLNIYKEQIDKNYMLITKSLSSTSAPVLYSSCNCLDNNADISKGSIPIQRKTSYSILLLILPIILIIPLAVIFGYSKILQLLNIEFSSVSTMVGAIISAILTSFTTLFVAKQKF